MLFGGLHQEVAVKPHILLLTDPMSMLQKVELEAQICTCHSSTATFEDTCRCTVMDILESREMTWQIDWQAKQPSQELHLRMSEVLRSLGHYLQAQSQEPHHQLPGGERCRKSMCLTLTVFLEMTIGDEHWNWFKGNVGETSEMGWSTI